jgi:phospholipid transport system substrate-binding protein
MRNTVTVPFLLFFFLSLFAFIPADATAGEPTDQVKRSVDAVLEVLKDKDLMRPEKTEQRRAKLRTIISERFDFEEMAKRSLAQHWKKRTPEEQKEFVALFTDLIENTYLKKIERYHNEKIVYRDEKTDADYATLKSSILTAQETEIPLEYRLLKKGGKWMAYDVMVEGVSLVNNYRNQFNDIIRTSSYEELVKRLKNKGLKEPVS